MKGVLVKQNWLKCLVKFFNMVNLYTTKCSFLCLFLYQITETLNIISYP